MTFCPTTLQGGRVFIPSLPVPLSHDHGELRLSVLLPLLVGGGIYLSRDSLSSIQ
jgi:hypothetical protein